MYISLRNEAGNKMNTRTVRIFDKQANGYAKRRKKLQQARERSKLLKHATGEVLEVSVGAGNNFPFYPADVRVTAVDFSPKMIEKAKEAAEEWGIQGKCIVGDIESLSIEDNTYETIVSTLSLCAYENPDYVMRQFRRWVKPGGKVLLLEHGISSKPAFAWLQNRLDGLSVRLIGCHQNRNILQLIHEAGLRIERLEKMMLDSVYLIVATVEKEA
ncbi:class I SAM-dependent methyltransferase [Paenibacillus sp. TRM 82003]|nr:class I SAM-dependent methyltransferase [Paenibacillus sp. TRM 82003]